MFWIIFIIIIIVIILAINNASSNTDANEFIERGSEYEKYTDELYETFYVDNILLDVLDGKYDAAIFSSHKEGHDYPIEVRIENSSRIIGYLFDDKRLYNILINGSGYLFAPLFIKTTTDGLKNRFAYIYIEKKLLSVRQLKKKETYNNYNDDGYITSQDIENILLDLDEYSDGDDYIELPIRGINFRGLGSSNIGYFEGYITTDKCNKYDKFAISIYGNDGTHFGFIEKGQEFLYNKIEEVGGIINVSIEVHPFTNDLGQNKLSGTITIDKEILK